MSGDRSSGVDRRALVLWLLALLAVAIGIWVGVAIYDAWSALPAAAG